LSASFFGEIASLGEKTKLKIFSRCKSHLEASDILIALLDGSHTNLGSYSTDYASNGLIGAMSAFLKR